MQKHVMFSPVLTLRTGTVDSLR